MSGEDGGKKKPIIVVTRLAEEKEKAIGIVSSFLAH
jgi:hypothetical protein